MGKGEIARYEQFLLFPQCFQKVCFPGASKGVIDWEWVKKITDSLLFIIVTNQNLFQETRFRINGRVQRIHSSAHIYEYKMGKDE